MSKTKSILEELSGVLGATASAEFEVTRFVNSGYAPLNKRISGSYSDGYPQGRIIEMFGPSMCGKTALATLAMKAAVAVSSFKSVAISIKSCIANPRIQPTKFVAHTAIKSANDLSRVIVPSIF